MKKNRKIMQITILLAVIIIGIYTIGNSWFSDRTPIPKEGEKALNFTLGDLDGQIHRLEEYRGKGVVINFWGTFCPPCVREMPLIQEYYERYKEQNLVVLGLNLDEPEVTVKSFVKENGITYPILMDDFTVRDQYGVVSYPTTFFIDPKGLIKYKFIGEMNEQQFRYRVLQILPVNQ